MEEVAVTMAAVVGREEVAVAMEEEEVVAGVLDRQY